MKKWIAALAAALLLSCPVTALAAQPDSGTMPQQHGVTVYGVYQSSKDYYEITLGIQGLDTVTLPDGVTIRGQSDSAADNGLQVIIIPVTAGEEAEAYAWVTTAAARLGKDPAVYYFAFRRGDSFTQPEGSVTLAVTAEGLGAKTLFYMDGDARSRQLTGTAAAGGISFRMEQTGYYLFEKTETQRHPGHSGGRTPDKPDTSQTAESPETGDTTPLLLYQLGIGASVLALAAMLRRGRKTTDH